MDSQLQDIFDIDQIIPLLSPVTPETQAFIDSFDLGPFDTKISGQEEIYYQDAEQPVEISISDTPNGGQQSIEHLNSNNNKSEERQIAANVSGGEFFGSLNSSTKMQAIQEFAFEDFTFDTDNFTGGYTTIDDSQIDPALHMLDVSSEITPSKLFYYAPSEPQHPTKGSAVYEPIDLSSPKLDLEGNMAYQLSQFNQLPASQEATHFNFEYLNNQIVPIELSDFFKSTAVVPRIRIDGSYAVEDNKSGSVYQYTTYTPLSTWHAPGFGSSGISYNSLGFLNRDIQFTSSTLTSFIRHHPLGPRLILRIEKHPYEVKGRFAAARGKPKYTCCRDANCVLGGGLKVGDLRVAIDEVTGRFKENDEQDNDPYFSSGYLHLQCFETLINVAPLVHMGLLIPDTRKDFVKEPPCRRGVKNNNKMALNHRETTAFNDWLKSSTSSQSQVLGKESLTSKIWLANCKKSRIKCLSRAPPGITQEDINAQTQTHALWGGRRAVGRSVAEMNRLEQEGRCDELIAPRNGTSGKLGMGPTGATALRTSKRKNPFGESKRGRPPKQGRNAPPSSPNPYQRKTILHSPPQKTPKAPRNAAVYSPPVRKILSPVSVFPPSLGDWSLLDTPSLNKSFVTIPLGPKSLQPATPTRRSPRLHKKVDYTDFDSEDDNLVRDENDKENGDWNTNFDELFEEFLC